MKPTKFIGPFVLALILILAGIALYALIAPLNQGDAPLSSTPQSASAPVAPIDISNLRAANVSRVELHCSGAASIAPDSERYICAGGPDKPGLWLGSLGNGLQKCLAENGGPPAVWLPKSKAVVYTAIVPDQPTMLYEVDIETGERTAISPTTYPDGGDHLQVLPDGRVVFLEKGALQVWDSTTKKTQTLQAIGCSDPTTHAAVASYYTAVSPDGARVAEACAGSLYLIDVRTGKKITLSDQVGIFVQPTAWSPDGRHLAYSVQPDSTRVAELWLVNADGLSPRRLWRDESARAFEWLTWMPDGQTLLFVKNAAGSSFEVGWSYMAINVTGEAPKQLFTNGEGLDLFANGSKILILRSVEDSGDWIVELAQ